MTKKEVWNEISKDVIVSIKDSLNCLHRKAHAIFKDDRRQSNQFLRYTSLQHDQVYAATFQISASANIGVENPAVLGSSSITIACLTRYLIELYGVLKFLQENPKDGIDEWCRYNEIKLAEYSEVLDNLGVLRKEFAYLNQSLQKSKNTVLQAMSINGLNTQNMNKLNVLMTNTKFTDDATRIGSKYYQWYQYLSKFTHPTLVGMYSGISDSSEVLNVCVGLTKALMDDFNQLYANIIDKFGINLES